MIGLKAATRLTTIWVADHQYLLGTLQWPPHLPHLTDIMVPLERSSDCFDALPEAWQCYNSLTSLTLPPFIAADLPQWFTALHKLRCLRMKFPHVSKVSVTTARTAVPHAT